MVVMRHELPLRAPVERLDVAPVGDRGVLAVKRRARAGLRAKPEQVEERDLDHAAVRNHGDALAGVPLIARLPARVRWRSAETEDALHGDSAVVERARFDAALLALAEKRGVEVMRPARVSTQNATSGGWQLVLESEHGATLLEAGFVIDARGRAGGAARLDCAPALAASWAEWDCGTLPAQWHGTTRVEALATGWLWGTRLPDGGLPHTVVLGVHAVRSFLRDVVRKGGAK